MTDIVSPEARRYAVLLAWGTRAGLLLLVLAFAVYLTGLLPSHVPPERLPQLWQLPVRDYLRATHSPSGWCWLGLLGQGDYANLPGIVLLTSCSIPPLLAVIPLFARQRARAYVIICLLQVLVLLLAASGLLGHH